MTPKETETLKNITAIQKNRFEAAFKSIDVPLPLNLEQLVLQYIEDELKVSLTSYELAFLLVYDGFAKSELLRCGLDDTEARDSLHSAISYRYLNMDWPTYGDDIDLNGFLNNLKSAIIISRQ